MFATSVESNPDRSEGDGAGTDRAAAANLLRLFGTELATSPLYSAMCEILAESAQACDLLSAAPQLQRRGNLLFAAIHASILRDRECTLAEWYPTVGGSRGPNDPDLVGAIGDFLLERQPELAQLIATGATQTNEPNRCAVLRVALAHVAQRISNPIALIDVGCSAGLNLHFDSYAYEYHQGEAALLVGARDSSVVVRTDAASSLAALPINLDAVSVESRVGVDVNPLDVGDEGATRWLRALMWPDQTERYARLDAALLLARENPVDIRCGDAVDAIEGLLDAVDTELHPVVITSWVMTYLSPERRTEFVSVLRRVALRRPLSWVFMEHPDFAPGLPFPSGSTEAPDGVPGNGQPMVWVHGAPDVEFTATLLGFTHSHATWLCWNPGNPEPQPVPLS